MHGARVKIYVSRLSEVTGTCTVPLQGVSGTRATKFQIGADFCQITKFNYHRVTEGRQM